MPGDSMTDCGLPTLATSVTSLPGNITSYRATIQGIVENRAIGYDDGRPHSALRGLSAREYVENTPKTLTAVGLQDGVRSGRHNGGVGRH